MPDRFEQVKRPHNVRFERSNRVCPGHGGQALRSEMEDVSWLIFTEELR